MFTSTFELEKINHAVSLDVFVSRRSYHKSQLPLMLADYDSYISNFKQERESLRSLDPQQQL